MHSIFLPLASAKLNLDFAIHLLLIETVKTGNFHFRFYLIFLFLLNTSFIFSKGKRGIVKPPFELPEFIKVCAG